MFDDSLTAGSDQRQDKGLTPTVAPGPILADPFLGMNADVVDDLERVRCANENRLRQLTRPVDQFDADGLARGFGLDLSHPDVARCAGMVAMMNCKSKVLEDLGWLRPPKERGKACCMEHQAVANLELSMRQYPLGEWVKTAPGVGLKQAARLLAVIRDPFWNEGYHPDPDGGVEKDGSPVMVPRDQPRTVSALWAYCGMHVVNGQAPRRQRGQKSNWNENARKRIWLVAQSCLKQKPETRYRKVYDETRAKYADAVHAAECHRCGPKGKPAQPGSPLALGHQHARGTRAICKEILKDLWIEARRLHEIPDQLEKAA